MRQFKFGSALLITLILVGCGGGGSDVPAKPKFTSQVSFGDSLSDVGTYNVGEVAAAGGGQFTINGPNANGKAANGNNIINWTEVMAMNLGLTAPCPAWTGMVDFPLSTTVTPTNVPPVLHAGCTGYAQGGARVTLANGIHNYLNNAYGPSLGGHELTYPVAQQITQYLTDHNQKFSGNEIVYVMAGANDLAYQLSVLIGTATAVGTAAANAAVTAEIGVLVAASDPNCIAPNSPASLTCQGAAVAALGGAAAVQAIGNNAANTYVAANAPAAGLAMATAATELVGYVNTQILGKGAKYVVVTNMGDFASVPATASYSQAQKDTLITPMITAFNDVLKAGLATNANVAYLDFYASSKDQIANPAKYGLTNVRTPACNNTNARALYCNASTLITGVTADSHYLFADDRHPTPYGYALIAQGVLQAMTAKGWY
jgi:phospholipase/lecithinase/hemolysin